MDHIPLLSESYRGNTVLLVIVGQFTGFDIVRASKSRDEQTGRSDLREGSVPSLWRELSHLTRS
ncbi:uncharacterized protein CCR75_000113 [Bremia lactucae]|uniref:Uncharacterized protein n=1 Tax=Bremia lactucae TaxID=4779 RepID=A0A976IIK5_BRELC|nr:hypothetical protein CCR75_000113 [Bremia lactucae]